MKRFSSVLISGLVTLTAACGGPDEILPDGGAGADARPGTDAPDQPDAGPTYTAFALGTDYQSGTGVASTITLPGLDVTTNVTQGVAGSDAVVRHIGDRLYIVNRLGADNVTILDDATFQLIDQISTGAGSNPYDVAVVGNKLFVPVFAGAGVAVLDATMPNAGVIDTIDLSDLDPTDDQPNCSSAYAVGNRVVVTCQLLDDTFAAQAKGKVVVIDATDNSVTTSFDLTYRNPFGYLQPTPPGSALGGDLLVATIGAFGATGDGCIERITIGATISAAGCLPNTVAAIGDITQIAYGPDDTLWFTYTDADFQSHLRTYDVGAQMVSAQALNPSSQSLSDVTICPTGHLVVADGAFGAAGVRIYDADGTEVTSAALDIGLPPVYQQGLVCY